MAVLFQGRLHAFGTPDELAADLWSDTEVRLDVGGPASAELLAALSAVDPVVQAVPTGDGALVRVRSVDATPALVFDHAQIVADYLAFKRTGVRPELNARLESWRKFKGG